MYMNIFFSVHATDLQVHLKKIEYREKVIFL